MADAQAVSRSLGEDLAPKLTTAQGLWLVARMAWLADGYLPLVMVRLSIAARSAGIPLLPMIFRRVAILLGQVHIGAPVILGKGLVLPHGQVVIDGITQIGDGAIIRPFCTIGLIDGDFTGPTLGNHVQVGTGARILGPVHVGHKARVGANAVVLADVPEGAVAVGVPAKAMAER